jgi:hypothetical protein
MVFWSILQVFFYYKPKIFNLSFRLIKFLDLLLTCRSWTKLLRYYFWWSTGSCTRVRWTILWFLFQILDVFDWLLLNLVFCVFVLLLSSYKRVFCVDLKQFLIDCLHLWRLWNSVSSDNLLFVGWVVVFLLGDLKLLDKFHLNF